MKPLAPSPRRVSIAIGRAAPPKVASVPPGLCLLGVAPAGWPSVALARPELTVRSPRARSDGIGVEHLRVGPGVNLSAFPGLEGPAPSVMRDAIGVALAAGAPRVDVVLVHAPGMGPANVGDAALPALLDPILDELRGWMIAIPDAGSALQDGGTPEPVTDRRKRVVATVRAHAAGWRRRMQVGLVDGPPGDDEALVARILGADVAIVRFVGDRDAMRRHGWRSAAAALGGALARPNLPVTAGVAGRRVTLGAGRWFAPDRRVALGLVTDPAPVPDPDASVLQLLLGPEGAQLVGETTLRKPYGEWALPVLRSVKLIHLAILAAAEPFVFRPVEDSQAIALMAALDEVVRPFAQLGVLVGPGGTGGPVIETDVIRDPAAPGLIAMVSAQLRPWAREIRMRVGVAHGDVARVEVAA